MALNGPATRPSRIALCRVRCCLPALSQILGNLEHGAAGFAVGDLGEGRQEVGAPRCAQLGVDDRLMTGADVTVLARNEELTSQQAADFLNVSRQYMVRLLERGDIASTKVGTHRRVRAEDLAHYRHRRDEGRAAALADMADQAQAAGGYDEPAAFGPRRKA